MINWPDMKFPPVNLYSVPHQKDVKIQYINLEDEYCNEVLEELYTTKEGRYREVLKDIVATRRKEFNKLWNARAEG